MPHSLVMDPVHVRTDLAKFSLPGNKSYPSYETYRALYARYYLGKPVDDLLQFLEPIKGQRVLDLCGGDGQIAVAAVARGANGAVLVDHSAEMISPAAKQCSGVAVHPVPVENFLVQAFVKDDFYDRIICRQGVNYWLDERTARTVSWVLKPRGVFVFNTFNELPPFSWLSPERLVSMLEPHFLIQERRRGATSVYRCEKRWRAGKS
jgi:SAM-dependent methyltransferase